MRKLCLVLCVPLCILFNLPALALECDNRTGGTAPAVAPDDDGDGGATACGDSAVAGGDDSTALGYAAISAGEQSLALGNTASSAGAGSSAVGLLATAGGDYSAALGYAANASGLYSTALGFTAAAAGESSTALGRQASAAANYSTALGFMAAAAGGFGTALGTEASAGGAYSTALGRQSAASGSHGVALGSAANSTGLGSVALGRLASTQTERGTAVGYASTTVEIQGTAVGAHAWSGGSYSSAFGAGSSSGGNYSTAIGFTTASAGSYSIALGNEALTSGMHSTALGSFSRSIGEESTALGYRAYADQPYTVIIGSVAGVNQASGYARVGIGTTSPTEAVDVQRSQAAARFQLTSFTNDPVQAPQYIQRRARGTVAAPAAVQANDNLGLFSFRGYNGSVMGGSRATITAQAAGNFTTNSTPTQLIFATTPSGKTVPEQVLVITHDGKVQVKGTNLNVPDYVFEDDYPLMPLDELRSFIDTNGHLPGIPSADVVNAEGLDLAGAQLALLAKVEELTLYTLDQQATIEEQRTRIDRLESLLERVLAGHSTAEDQ